MKKEAKEVVENMKDKLLVLRFISFYNTNVMTDPDTLMDSSHMQQFIGSDAYKSLDKEFEVDPVVKQLDDEVTLLHQCVTELYNGHDSNVPIIKPYLDKIHKLKDGK